MGGGIIPPMEVIATWPVPNYVNPETRGLAMVIVTSVLAAMSLVIVCARMVARIKLGNVGIDDWVIIATMPPAMAMSVLICIASKLYGFNKHTWDNPLQISVDSRKVVMAIEALYVFCTGLVKISILLFYRRLVAGTVSRSFVWAVRVAIFSVVAYMIAFENTLMFGCKPFHAYWDQVNPFWRTSNKYFCLNEVATLYAANITSIIQDFVTFAMPLLLFVKLKLPMRQKVALGAIFGIGFFLCVVGVIRIVYTHNVYFTTYDVTWESEPIWLWTAVEFHGAVLCASAPALKVFFKRYLRVGTNRSGGPSGGSGGSGSRRSNKFRRIFARGFSSRPGRQRAGDVEAGIDQEKLRNKLRAVEGSEGVSYGSTTVDCNETDTVIGGPGSAYWWYPSNEMGNGKDGATGNSSVGVSGLGFSPTWSEFATSANWSANRSIAGPENDGGVGGGVNEVAPWPEKI